MKELIFKAKTLIEALPYIKKWSGKRIVIKYGGNAMENPALQEIFTTDVALMHYVGIEPIIVHGGGPQITKAMEKEGITPIFLNGLRLTDKKTIEIVKEVLIDEISKEIVGLINNHGELSVSLSGDDIKLISASKSPPQVDELTGKPVDLGYVGLVDKVNKNEINDAISKKFIPVIASIGYDDTGQAYNINADVVASEIAKTIGAEKIIFLTDVDGIFDSYHDKKSLISKLNIFESEQILKSGKIEGGMIPKLNSCIDSLKGGVGAAHILNGTIEHALLLEIFTEKGIGTMITGDAI